MIIINAFHQSDFFGKMIFLSLLLFSIMTWYLFLKKWFMQNEIKKKGASLQSIIQKNRLHPLACEIKDEQTHPFFEIYKNLKLTTLELLKKNKLAATEEIVYLSRSDIVFIENQVMMTISNQMKKMESNLFILSTIVSLAPFLGLLGTVWGILLTFAELQKGVAIHANTTVMGGLAMALGTTVVGLIVAIPALIGYNYLKTTINKLYAEMEDFARNLLSSVEFHYRKIDL